jgi:hypothetical protein
MDINDIRPFSKVLKQSYAMATEKPKRGKIVSGQDIHRQENAAIPFFMSNRSTARPEGQRIRSGSATGKNIAKNSKKNLPELVLRRLVLHAAWTIPTPAQRGRRSVRLFQLFLYDLFLVVRDHILEPPVHISGHTGSTIRFRRFRSIPAHPSIGSIARIAVEDGLHAVSKFPHVPRHAYDSK